MFGTANMLLMVVEVAERRRIFDDPETVQKVERITLELLHDMPGVNGEQVMSITHPKLKTTLTAGSGIKVVPLMYPRVPENKEDLEFLRQKVYTTEGVRGFFVSDGRQGDDDHRRLLGGVLRPRTTMWTKVQEIVEREESDANTKIYVTGPPILYAYFIESDAEDGGRPRRRRSSMILLILWIEFRSWQGVVDPGVLRVAVSAIWGLGFGGLCAATQPRSAGARDPAPDLGARALALRAVDGALPRGVPSPAGQGRGDRQVVHRDLRAGDGVDRGRRARDPDARRGAHPDHPEARLRARSGSSGSSSAS